MDFDLLAARHKDAVYREMLRLCGNRDDAEDVLADSMVKAYRFLGQLSDESAFRPWLTQIARRTCGRLKRRESLRPLLSMSALEEAGIEPATTAPTPLEQALERDTRECLYRALDSLPPMYREVYEARDIEGLSGPEVAKQLGMELATVKTRLHRARKMVRDLLDSMLADRPLTE